MTPTLLGRIETRIFTVFTAGLLWTLLITPLLGAPIATTFRILVLVAVLGVVIWDPIYQLLLQFRWEKDWPAMFILLEGINEGLLVRYVLVHTVPAGTAPSLGKFIAHFATTWLVLFVVVHGPLRVPFLRWRFRGGRII
jgi:hypothetical protein